MPFFTGTASVHHSLIIGKCLLTTPYARNASSFAPSYYILNPNYDSLFVSSSTTTCSYSTSQAAGFSLIEAIHKGISPECPCGGALQIIPSRNLWPSRITLVPARVVEGSNPRFRITSIIIGEKILCFTPGWYIQSISKSFQTTAIDSKRYAATLMWDLIIET